MKYKSFRDMPVWNEAMELSVNIHSISNNLPKSEDYGLTSQIRRSSCSIHANLAEGFGRLTHPDKNRFYIIARGSAFETQSHLIYGQKVSYFSKEIIDKLLKDYDKLIHDLNKIIKSLS